MCEVLILRLDDAVRLLDKLVSGEIQEMASPAGLPGRETPLFTPFESTDESSSTAIAGSGDAAKSVLPTPTPSTA